jgi:type IV pilus assembly protein PilN
MIRINLRPDALAATAEAGAEVDVADSEIQRKGLVNLMVFFILPAALYVYGAQAKPKKEAQIQTLNSQIEELTTFNNKQSSIVLEISRIEQDERDVEKKVNAIASVSQGRLVEIKVLDLLQTIVREKMWLKSVEIETAKEGATKDNSTKINIEGIAQTEMDVSLFLEDLTKNTLFKEVGLVESQLFVYEGQNFSRFKIAGILEKSK